MARRFLVGLVAGIVIVGSGWYVWSELRPRRPVRREAPLEFTRANAAAQKVWAAQEYVSLDTVSDPQQLAAMFQGPIDAAIQGFGEQDRADLARLVASELWIHRPGVTLGQYIEFVESDPSMRWVDETQERDAWNVRVLRAFHWDGPIPEVIEGEEALRRCWALFEARDRIVAVGEGENVLVASVVAKRDPAVECMLAVDPPAHARFFPPGVPGAWALAFRVPRVSAEEVLAREGRVQCVVVCVLVKTDLDRAANVYFNAFWDPASGLWSIDHGMNIQSEHVRFLY